MKTLIEEIEAAKKYIPNSFGPSITNSEYSGINTGLQAAIDIIRSRKTLELVEITEEEAANGCRPVFTVEEDVLSNYLIKIYRGVDKKWREWDHGGFIEPHKFYRLPAKEEK